MKRPVIKKRNLKPFFSNNPVLGRVTAAFVLLFSPIILTIYLWKEYGNECRKAFEETWEVLIGKWED